MKRIHRRFTGISGSRYTRAWCLHEQRQKQLLSLNSNKVYTTTHKYNNNQYDVSANNNDIFNATSGIRRFYGNRCVIDDGFRRGTFIINSSSGRDHNNITYPFPSTRRLPSSQSPPQQRSMMIAAKKKNVLIQEHLQEHLQEEQQQEYPFKERLHVLGGGSIGLLWSAYIRLSFPSYPITLLFRKHTHQDRLQKHHKKKTRQANNHYRASVFLQNEEEQQDNIKHRYRASICLFVKQQNPTKKIPRQNPIMRPRTVLVPAELIDNDEIEIENENENKQEKNSNDNNNQPIQKQKPIRNLIITTKAFDATNAVASVYDRLQHSDGTTIIVLCNGALAVKEELVRYFQFMQQQQEQSSNKDNNIRIVLALTTNGAYKGKRQEKNPALQLPPRRQLPTIPQENDDDKIKNQNIGSEEDDDNDNNDIGDGNSDGYIYQVFHAGVGITKIEDHPSIAKLWNMSGLGGSNFNVVSVTQNEMVVSLWQKLAANCVINPLTAILKCKNGALLEIFDQIHSVEMEEKGLPSIKSIIQEISTIAVTHIQHQQQQKESENENELKNVTNEQQQQQQMLLLLSLSPRSLTEFIRQVIVNTSENYSSMYQDIHGNSSNDNNKNKHENKKDTSTGNKTITEIDYLNGYAIRLGQQYNIDTNANQTLCRYLAEKFQI